MLDVVTQETILEEVVDEVVLVGTKKPGDNPGDNLGGNLGDNPRKNLGDKAPGSSNNQPNLQSPSVNSNGLKTLPNTGESENGMTTVAGLVALAVATRLRKKAKGN